MRKLPREYWYVIAIGVIFIIVFCLAIVAECYKETNTIAEWSFAFFTKWAMVLSAAATLLLAGAAFWAIMDNRHAGRLEKKERLLNKIIEWAEAINEISLTPDIPLTSTYVPLMRKQREVNELLRYGISMSKVISIETIASERFKNELLQDVKKVANTLAKFICIRQLKSLGVLPTEEAMPGKAREEIKQEIDEGKKSVDQIWQDYAMELADNIRELLIRANVIKANLLK